MKKLLPAIAALACSISVTLPAIAGSHRDVQELAEMIKSTGTTVSFNDNRYDKNCLGLMGYYHFEKDKSDILVICSDQVNLKDSDEVWETLAHEATHTMQACNGGPIFKSTYHPRIFRALGSKAPHYAKMIDNSYAGDKAIIEAEAFWMELQTPEVVKKLFYTYCIHSD
jgi:hypothetical protein